MFSAAFSAIEDVMSKKFRSVLWKSIGLTIVLFIAIFLGVEVLLSVLTTVPWPWMAISIPVRVY